jgi:hypothetical protein
MEGSDKGSHLSAQDLAARDRVAPRDVETEPGFGKLSLETTDIGQIRYILETVIKANQAPDAPRSRERALMITKLEEASLWAGQVVG